MTEPAIRNAPPCPRCGATDGLVWVHGHGQCVACGSNVDECCQGAPCDLASGTPGSKRDD